LRRELRLEAGSELLALLRWEKLTSFEAVGEARDGRWIIGRRPASSLLGAGVVRDAPTMGEGATPDPPWRRPRTLRSAAGGEFQWERTGFWRTTFFWSTTKQPRLLAFKSLFGLNRRYAMEADPAAHGLSQLPVLVLLGAYLMALESRRRHAH